MRIHILGICGTLMGSIALLARAQGHMVSGSDANVYPPMSTQLSEADIQLDEGYRSDSVPEGTELVIVGNSNLPRGNAALEQTLSSGIPYTSGAEWLGRYLLSDRWVIAIAGTHGKTTTSTMVTWILKQCGLDPGYLIGGVPLDLGQSSSLGSTPFFVIEADEYDTSYFDRRSKFLHYRPRTLVLNNLEYDHADIFPDLDAIKQQFHLLVRSIPREGLIIHPDNDANLIDVLSRGCWSETLPLGNDGIRAMMSHADGSSFDVLVNGKKQGEVTWGLTGEHNVNNALAAIAAARHVGVKVADACSALCQFGGVKRRMEVIYGDERVTVYDDFAHHPTAIRSTLDGLRNRVGSDKIIAVIEPASHTMRKGTHADSLVQSASDADLALWFKPASLSWEIDDFADKRNRIFVDHSALIVAAIEQSRDISRHCHVVIMSNGSFNGIHQEITKSLAT